jgi:hypothetical protein
MRVHSRGGTLGIGGAGFNGARRRYAPVVAAAIYAVRGQGLEAAIRELKAVRPVGAGSPLWLRSAWRVEVAQQLAELDPSGLPWRRAAGPTPWGEE